jgi:predicted dehydrogenase
VCRAPAGAPPCEDRLVAPIRLALVGCGAVGVRYHLPAIDASDRVSLVAAVDRDLERARDVASSRGAAALTDFREVAAYADAAVVAVPNWLHATVGTALLDDGVDVLVEKPMARSPEECDALLAAAARSGSTLAVGLDFRYFPPNRLVKDILRGGTLGEVVSFDLRQGGSSRWPFASGYAFGRQTAGGGVLVDYGVHMLDLLLWWLGDLDVVAFKDDARGGVETDCKGELRSASGAVGTFQLSRVRELRNTCVIATANGELEVGLFAPDAEVRLRWRDAESELRGAAADEASLRDVFVRQLHDFVDATLRKKAPFVSGDEGRRSVALIAACYEAREPLVHEWDFPEAYAAIGV